MVPQMVVLQKPRGARPLWVVVSSARTLKVAVPPPRSSPQVGLPLSLQTRSQAFQVSPTLVREGTPSLDGGGQVSVTAMGTPSDGGGPRAQAQGTSRGCGSPLCRDER